MFTDTFNLRKPKRKCSQQVIRILWWKFTHKEYAKMFANKEFLSRNIWFKMSLQEYFRDLNQYELPVYASSTKPKYIIEGTDSQHSDTMLLDQHGCQTQNEAANKHGCWLDRWEKAKLTGIDAPEIKHSDIFKKIKIIITTMTMMMMTMIMVVVVVWWWWNDDDDDDDDDNGITCHSAGSIYMNAWMLTGTHCELYISLYNCILNK